MAAMKALKQVLLLAICVGLVLCADTDLSSNNNSNNTDKPQNNTDTNQNLPNKLCASCKCDASKRIFDCSSMKLNKLFSMSEWQTLNESGIATDNMLLKDNGLSEIPVFPALDIIRLDLSNNDISVIAKRAFFALPKLEVLDLSHNKLTTKSLIPEIFEGHYNPDEYLPMEKLKVLLLGYNQLHSLDQDLFEHMPNLEELSLVSNTFKVIDKLTEIAIASVKTLRSLDLSYMELEMIPNYIFNSPLGLEHLNLTGNLLPVIPEALKYASNLKWLSLDENPLRSIQGEHVFPAMIHLEYLGLSYITPLRIIGRGAFSKLESLKEVHICNNPELSHLHGDAFVQENPNDPQQKVWPGIKRLYLHNNNLTTLDSQMLTHWASMEVVDIRMNPWDCDCENEWLIETLLPVVEKTTPSIMNNVVCATPPQMAGLSMVELQHKHSQMRCKDKYGNNPQNDGALLMGLLIGILVGIPLTGALLMMYKRGCFGLIRRGPADYSRAFYTRTTSDDF